MPRLGASPRRTLRGITVRNTFSLKNCADVGDTCWPRLVRSSNIVSSTPSMSSRGLSAAANAAHRADEVGEALERRAPAVQRDQHRVSGDTSALRRQQSERRRAVDEDVVELAAERLDATAQPFFARRQRDQFDLCAGRELRSAGMSDSRSTPVLMTNGRASGDGSGVVRAS